MLTTARYVTVDGGSGAHLFAALAQYDKRVHAVASTRHANLLLIAEPIGQKLVPALAEYARALPQPAHALVLGKPGEIPIEQFIPGTQRLEEPTAEKIVQGALQVLGTSSYEVRSGLEQDTTSILLPPKHDHPLATELVVLSLGPIQPFTAGPLRVLLTCDGEQVVSAQVESGYAHRGLASRMESLHLEEAARLARLLDPLAPVACETAYIRAVEQLRGVAPAPEVAARREAALALERAQNHLWWLVRFAIILEAPDLAARAYRLAQASANGNGKDECATEADALGRHAEHDRWLGLRTRGIGAVPPARLQAAGVDGPTLKAAEEGAGDVQSRLVARLYAAARDLAAAARPHPSAGDGWRAALVPTAARYDTSSQTEATASGKAEGPRGTISVRVTARGETLLRIRWDRHSTKLLALVPEFLANAKLADAETILASLDLSMAEVDE